jgi:hypothetical protein
MGLFSFLRTSEKALDTASNVVNAGVAGIDKLFYTNEEKAENALKLYQLWLDMQKATAGENTAKSITRRILAIIILGTTITMALGACIVYPLNAVWAAFILSIMKELGFMTVSVVIFYFGYYAVKQITGEKK